MIDGKEYTAEDGSVYFVVPGSFIWWVGSRGCRLLHPPVSSRIYFVSVGWFFGTGTFLSPADHTLSFPCNFQRMTTQQQRHPVLLDQIINANSDGIAAEPKKRNTKTSLAPAFFSWNLCFLWQNRICFIPAIPKAPAVSRKSCYLIFSKITVFAFLCTISPDISICPKNISPGISGNISSLRSRSISRTCGYPTQSICWKPQVSPSQRQHCRAAFQT